jgi:hypothetical protein
MTSTTKVNRQTVDLSAYPDLIVIYLGMRAKSLRGIATLLSLGRQIARAAAAKPNGLLLHENFMMSLLRLMSACGNTGVTLALSKRGRGRCRIMTGGRTSCAIRAVLRFGMKPIAAAAGLRRSTMISTAPSA